MVLQPAEMLKRNSQCATLCFRPKVGGAISFGQQCDRMHHAQLQSFLGRAVHQLQQATWIARGDDGRAGGFEMRSRVARSELSGLQQRYDMRANPRRVGDWARANGFERDGSLESSQ